jgi:DamX protein
LFNHGKFPVKAQIKSPDSGYPLITRERTEKLELLSHLVSNLAHAIVVCGPEGVGKTKVLKAFQDATEEPWIFCCLTGDNQLKLDKIQESLSDSIVQAMPDLKSVSLANAFSRLATRNNKIILVIDDAGNLPPGLIEKIIAYAERKPVLRVIFALTHSEIYLKNGTDPAIDDCYQIDIPPLSEQECGDFLEYLATLQNPRIEFNAINENRVAALYSETHGIPGNILAKLPAPDNSKKPDYSKPVLFGC